MFNVVRSGRVKYLRFLRCLTRNNMIIFEYLNFPLNLHCVANFHNFCVCKQVRKKVWQKFILIVKNVLTCCKTGVKTRSKIRFFTKNDIFGRDNIGKRRSHSTACQKTISHIPYILYPSPTLMNPHAPFRAHWLIQSSSLRKSFKSAADVAGTMNRCLQNLTITLSPA